MAHYCRNWRRERVVDRKRLEYGEERIESNFKQIRHLKEMENLETLN